MPELPEVETTLRGLAPHLCGRRIQTLRVRERRLRWPIPRDLPARVRGQLVRDMYRRGKYLIVQLPAGGVIIHLGMSGSLRVLLQPEPPGAHDHFDLVTKDAIVRYRDPRRFGCLLWGGARPLRHKLLRELGVEPLSDAFDGEWLFERSRGRTLAVKNFIMNARVVVGVGNIYAAEALFRARIHPARAAQAVSRERYARLARAIKQILRAAIKRGGTTLRDFVNPDGDTGWFEQRLNVYAREGAACRVCGATIKMKVIGQRAACYCPRCQR